MTPITPSQCRAARALLGWQQLTLAAKAKVTQRTVALFELSERSPKELTLAKLRKALEKAGVVFIDRNGGGPGVRLKA